MSAAEIASLTVALLSLVIAAFAAYRTYVLSRQQLHLGTRHEFHKLLLDMNKELVRDPELWGLYDEHPMARVNADAPARRAKLEAFAYMALNILQIVFVFASENAARSPAEADYFRTWDGTLQDLVRGSTVTQEVLTRADSERVYEPRFLAHARSFLPE